MFIIALKLKLIVLIFLRSFFIFNENSSQLSRDIYLLISLILRLIYRSLKISSLYDIVLK